MLDPANANVPSTASTSEATPVLLRTLDLRPPVTPELNEKVLAMSKEIFPLGATIAVEPDLETGELYRVVKVILEDLDAMVELNTEWHHRMVGFTGQHAANYVLSMEFD
jgi:hypothetical protein